MTTTLKQLCNEVIESAAKATARPWEWGTTVTPTPQCRVYSIADTSYKHVAVVGNDLHEHLDSNYIVLAANNSEKLARALLVMEEAVNGALVAMPQNFDTYNVYFDLKEALARVNEILERR